MNNRKNIYHLNNKHISIKTNCLTENWYENYTINNVCVIIYPSGYEVLAPFTTKDETHNAGSG